jgi:hypothetical protein
MGRAWPRFLPEPKPEAIAHALIIEAYAIVVEQFADGHADLNEAHGRALRYAQSLYLPDEVRAARNACAAAPGNQTGRLPLLLGFRLADQEPIRPAA